MTLYQVGDVVQEFSAQTAEGQLAPLSQHSGPNGLLLFLLRGTWCPSCVMQIRSIQRYHAHYQAQGFQSLFVTAEDPDTVWTFRISQARPLPFGIQADPQRAILSQFLPSDQITVMPAVYRLTPQRQITWAYHGQRPDDRPSHQELLAALGA